MLASLGVCVFSRDQATAQTSGVETGQVMPPTDPTYEAVSNPVHQPFPSLKEDRDRDDDGFYMKMGPCAVIFDTKAVLKTQGAVIPDATINIHLGLRQK